MNLWQGTINVSLRSKRGRAALQEMEAVLLAMPIKALAAQDLVEPETGMACALGEVAIARRVRDGATREDAIAQIHAEYYEDDIDDEDRDWDEMTRDLGEGELKLSYPLMQTIAFNNDCFPTPERRWEWMLKWVQARLAEPPLTRKAKAVAP